MPSIIEPVRADDLVLMDAWFGLAVRCHAHDAPELPPPCPLSHANRFSWPGFAQHAWVVRDTADPAEVVAAAFVTLPQRDNRTGGFASVLVAPPLRRRGLGSQLLEHATAYARTQGRTRLALGADRAGAGEGFLRRAGARVGMTEMRRRLDLPPADPQRLRDLATAARRASADYRLVQWTGATPDEWLDDLAVLIGRMSTDAPMGELTMEAQRWDAARVRERDAASWRGGVRSVVTAAQAPDGRLAAFTEVSTCVVGDGYAMQGDTLVAPAHRGRRLGLAVKLANLDLLLRERPEVRAVDTFNADANRWMVAVNEQLGFRPLRAQTDWELTL